MVENQIIQPIDIAILLNLITNIHFITLFISYFIIIKEI